MAEQVRLELVVVDKTGAALGKAKGQIQGLNKSLGRTSGLAKAAGAALIAFGTGAILRGLINTIRQFEDLRATLVTVEGSTQQAAKSFDLIKTFTAGTTFQLGEVTNAFITFRNAGLVPTEQFMLNIGNIAAGMGRRLDDVARAVFNATTGEFEMLKQLGIKVKTEGDKLKVIFRGTTTEIRNNGIDIVNLVEEIGMKEFKGGIERSAKTLSGAFSNLKDAVAIAADEVGEGGLASALTEVTRELTKATLGTANLANSVGSALGNAVLFVKNNIGLLTVAFKLLALGFLVKQVFALKVAFAGLGVTIANVTKAIRIMTVAAMANPIIALATIAVGGIILFRKQLQKLGEKFGILTPKVEDSTKATNDFLHEMSEVPTVSAEAQAAQKILAQEQEKVAAATKKTTDKLEQSIRALEANAIANKVDAEIYKLKGGVLKNMTAEQEKEIRLLIAREQQLKKVAAAEKALPSIMGQIGGTFDTEDQFKKEFEQLEILRNEDLIAEKKYNDAIAILRRKASLQREKESKDRVDRAVNMVLKGQLEEIDLLNKTEKEKQQIALGAGKEALSVLATQNEKAFKLQKALAIAQALLDAKSIILSFARAGAIFGPIGAAAGAAAGVAFTAAQIAAISSQTYAGPREKGGQVTTGRSFLVGESGPELFTPDAGGRITPNDALGNVNISFTINAIDSRDIDTVLIERKQTIIGVINEALNRKGKQGVTN